MSTDSVLLAFKAISNFADELVTEFSKYNSVKLYAHLLKKTTLAHEKPIEKHYQSFRKFCLKNRKALEGRDHDLLNPRDIVYSKKVFIPVYQILKEADSSVQKVIWQHLLLISAYVDPAGKAKIILKENKNGESDFLKNIIDKVEKNVPENANPMEAVSSIMQSGVFQELVGGMNDGLQNGSLDLGKLMGSVQNMVSTLQSKTGGDTDPNTAQAMSAITTMLGSMNMDGKASGPPPDLSKMLGPLMQNMMGGSGGSMPSIETMLEKKMEKKNK
jgi:hypothetical protein